MIIGDRLSERLAAAEKTQADLARAIGVTPQAVSKMVRGPTTDTSKLYQIARFLGTTPEYLSGETDDPEDDVFRKVFPGAIQLADADEYPDDPDVVEIDQIDLKFGLGGTYIDGPVDSQKRVFSRDWIEQITKAPPRLLTWTVGDGDSMEPTIRSGEVILIDRSQTSPTTGDGIWACAYGEVGIVKRLRPRPDGTVDILSDNPLVPPDRATDGELYVIGRVVAVVRKL